LKPVTDCLPDINDVTIRDNHIFGIGQDGGIAAIDVSDGNFTNLNIIGNTIEDITSDGNLWGMIFDGEGTITDSTIKENKIRNLTDTSSATGIDIRHFINNLTIEENHITQLTADGPADFSSAEGICISSESITDFDIVENTIEEVETENGFFGEDIKIEPDADVSGIEIHENNLLSDIGLNNANGDNPEVDAEDNFWNDEDGPIVIENNDNDGDVPVPGGGEVDLDNVDESAVTENVDFIPFAESKK